MSNSELSDDKLTSDGMVQEIKNLEPSGDKLTSAQNSHVRILELKNSEPSGDKLINDGMVPEIKYNVINSLQHLSKEQLKEEYQKRADKSAVCILNALSDANVGLIIRNASCFAMGTVFIVGRRKFQAHTAVGTNHYIDIKKVSASQGPHDEFLDVKKIKEFLDQQTDYTLVFVEQAPHAVPLSKFDFNLPKPPMFIFGTESDGIPQELMINQHVVYIEQPGIIRSLNVAVCAGIVSYAWSQYKASNTVVASSLPT